MHVKSQCYKFNKLSTYFKFTKPKKFESTSHIVFYSSQSIFGEQYEQWMQLFNNKNNRYACFNLLIIDGGIDVVCNYIDSSGEHVSYIFNVIDDTSHELVSWFIDIGVIDNMVLLH